MTKTKRFTTGSDSIHIKRTESLFLLLMSGYYEAGRNFAAMTCAPKVLPHMSRADARQLRLREGEKVRAIWNETPGHIRNEANAWLRCGVRSWKNAHPHLYQ